MSDLDPFRFDPIRGDLAYLYAFGIRRVCRHEIDIDPFTSAFGFGHSLPHFGRFRRIKICPPETFS
jgi:hypothetical protein